VSPVHAGIFICEPDRQIFDDLKQIIISQEQHDHSSQQAWDPAIGWGTPIGDWYNVNYNVGGSDWSLNSGHADQGLLYYYFRYVLRDVAIVYKDRVLEWSPGGGDGQVPKKKSVTEVFGKAESYGDNAGCFNAGCLHPGGGLPNVPPYNLFYHFTGKSKP